MSKLFTPMPTEPNQFVKSAEKFKVSDGKLTLIYPEEISSAYAMSEKELNLFLEKGCDDIKKIEKTKEDIEKDKNVKIDSIVNIASVNPYYLLE